MIQCELDSIFIQFSNSIQYQFRANSNVIQYELDMYWIMIQCELDSITFNFRIQFNIHSDLIQFNSNFNSIQFKFLSTQFQFNIRFRIPFNSFHIQTHTHTNKTILYFFISVQFQLIAIIYIIFTSISHLLNDITRVVKAAISHADLIEHKLLDPVLVADAPLARLVVRPLEAPREEGGPEVRVVGGAHGLAEEGRRVDVLHDRVLLALGGDPAPELAGEPRGVHGERLEGYGLVGLGAVGVDRLEFWGVLSVVELGNRILKVDNTLGNKIHKHNYPN